MHRAAAADRPASRTLDRRTLLRAASLVTALPLLAACRIGSASSLIGGSSSPTRSVDAALVAALSSAWSRTSALQARWQGLQTDGVEPTLAAAAVTAHTAHLDALATALTTAGGSTSSAATATADATATASAEPTASAPTRLRSLATAERAAAVRDLRSLSAVSGEDAQMLASVAASSAGLAVLAAKAGRGSVKATVAASEVRVSALGSAEIAPRVVTASPATDDETAAGDPTTDTDVTTDAGATDAGETADPTTTAAVPSADAVAAVQELLAAEHAAVAGYAVIAGRATGALRLQGEYALSAHTARRDALIEWLDATGEEPVAAASGYDTSGATSAAGLRKLAVAIERAVGARALTVVGAADDPLRRQAAVIAVSAGRARTALTAAPIAWPGH